MRDLQCVGHQGFLAKDQPLNARAHKGFLTTFGVAIIPVREIIERNIAKTYILSPDLIFLQQKEEEEVLIIIQIFLQLCQRN